MPSSEFQVFSDRIYEAGFIPERWPQLLADIAHHVGGTGGSLLRLRETYVSAVSSPNFAELTPVFLKEGWAERDMTLKRGLAIDHAGFVNDADLLSDEEIATDYVYENFYRKHGMGYRAATNIPIPNGDSSGFVFYRHHDNGHVPRNVVNFLDQLRPHMARTSIMACRLGFERARAQADVLQSMGLPAAILHPSGRLYVANELFEAAIPTLFQDRASRLAIADARADTLFANAIASLAALGDIRSIAVAASAGRLPAIVHLLPMRRAAHDIFARAAALVVVTPVDRAAVPQAELLQGLFDLTPAEARVARAVAQASAIEDIALAQNTSRETIRTQLKAVLSKTGVSRQQELINLLAGKTFTDGPRDERFRHTIDKT